MDPKNVEFTLNFLTGQVHDLFMVTQMLANAQPEPVKVLSLSDALEQAGIASMEAQPVGTRRSTGCGEGFQAFAGPSRRRRPGEFRATVTRLPDAASVLALIDGFYDRLIARGVSRSPPGRGDVLAESATGQAEDGATRWAA